MGVIGWTFLLVPAYPDKGPLKGCVHLCVFLQKAESNQHNVTFFIWNKITLLDTYFSKIIISHALSSLFSWHKLSSTLPLVWCKYLRSCLIYYHHLSRLPTQDDFEQPISYLLQGHVPPGTVHLYITVWSTTYQCTLLTALFPGLPRRAGTRKAKPIWILLKQETVSGSGISWAICKSAPSSRQTTTPVSHHSIFYRPDALPAAQPTASKHWRPYLHTHYLPKSK